MPSTGFPARSATPRRQPGALRRLAVRIGAAVRAAHAAAVPF
ncbi:MULTISPECIES: hypothetical protein [unclassified Pseudonocardia]|nr:MULTISPECIES: hypothetical protein [unclassified Pseudonocardia]